MAIFNILLIYFYILQPSTNAGINAVFNNISSQPYSMGIYANGLKGNEIGGAVNISVGYNGYLFMLGAPSARYRYANNKYLLDISLIAIGDAYAVSVESGKYVKLKNRDIRLTGRVHGFYFYELSDKYSFIGTDVTAIMPFSWGKVINPFIGTEVSYNMYIAPGNIYSSPIIAFDWNLIYGINAKLGLLNFCLSFESGRNSISANFITSIVF